MKCTQCNLDKPTVEFPKDRRNKSGFKNTCKECMVNSTINGKPYREYMRDKQSTPEFKLKRKMYHAVYRAKPDVIVHTQEYRKRYNSDPGNILARHKYRALQSKNPRYRINNSMGNLTWRALRGGKLNRQWQSLVGYTIEQLMQHLEAQFDENMNWDNYGSYWQVDHIKPQCSFNYIKAEDQEFKRCWALDNLQPLEALENKRKQGKLNWSKNEVKIK